MQASSMAAAAATAAADVPVAVVGPQFSVAYLAPAKVRAVNGAGGATGAPATATHTSKWKTPFASRVGGAALAAQLVQFVW